MSAMEHVGAVHAASLELAQLYQDHPFDFLYETDLQATLFSLMLRKLDNQRLTVRGGCSYPYGHGSVVEITTTPVKCEYPSSGSPIGRFDVAVIDPARLVHYAQAGGTPPASDPFWNQKLLAAVEIKCCQLGARPSEVRRSLEKDIRKLNAYLEECKDRPFLGIAMLFIQSNSLPLGTFEGRGSSLESNERPDRGIIRMVVSPSHVRSWAESALQPTGTAGG